MGWLKKLITAITLTLLIAAVIFYAVFRPTHSSKLTYRQEQIRIVRDAQNIPFIEAESWKGFLYGWGHSTAEDRLFQISFKQVLMEGRLSEYLGEKTLEVDRLMHELNLDEWSLRMQRRLKKEDPQEYLNMQAFVDGINDCVAKMKILPLDFQLIGLKWQNWTIAKSYGIHKLVEWSQAMNIGQQFFKSMLLANYTQDEVEHFLPNVDELWAFPSQTIVKDEDIPSTLKTGSTNKGKYVPFVPVKIDGILELGLMPYLSSLDGSNSWTISGKHTASGRPILANDPHLESNIPCQWYQFRTRYSTHNDTIDYSGVSIAGMPLGFGKSRYIATTVTTIQYDNQDLYKETLKDDRYLVDGEWRDLKVRRERILVKGKQGFEEEIYTVRQTHRGPIVHYIFSPMGSFKITDELSLSWTGFNDEVESISALSHWCEIGDLPTLQNLLMNHTKYFFNINMQFITADDHLVYQQMGIYPLRRDQASGNFIKDGTTSQHDWIGIMPHQHRLQVTDPECGFQYTANNRIASTAYYDGHLKYTLYTARANRIHQMITNEITSGRKITVDFVKKMQTDNIDIYCLQILPEILSILPQANSTLGSFNCEFDSSSWKASIYQVFFYELHHLIKPHKTGNFSVLSLYTYQQYIYNHIHAVFQAKNSPSSMQTAWQNMLVHLSDAFKSQQQKTWRWGQYHKDVMAQTPYGRTPLAFFYNLHHPGSGNLNTPNLGKMNQQQLGNFHVSHRPNYRFIHTFSEGSWWIIDAGSSQNLLSPHYSDQWKLFMSNQWLPILDGPPSEQL